MRTQASIMAAVFVSLGWIGFAGQGGVAPTPGTYTFKQTAPPPSQAVGTGKFSSSGGVDSLRSQASGSNSTENWTRGLDGQYRRVPATPGDHGSLCILPDEGSAQVYHWKWNNVVMGEGLLEPAS